jgi:hypothetical protein
MDRRTGHRTRPSPTDDPPGERVTGGPTTGPITEPGWHTVHVVDTTPGADPRLVAAHETLTRRLALLESGGAWQRFLRTARCFTRYSPGNQLLLAAQVADRGYDPAGLINSYRRWSRVPAVVGGGCQVRRGEAALRIFAPLRATVRNVDEEAGVDVVRPGPVRGFRLVSVFHQDQLVHPPDIAEPARPQLLTGDGPTRVWEAIVAHLADVGYTTELVDAIPGAPDANGETRFAERRVLVRADLDLPQRQKTAFHELAHVLLHAPGAEGAPAGRAWREVEAESCAYLCADAVGFDSGAYTLPYLASWLGGTDATGLAATAQRVLAAAATVTDRLAAALDVDLHPDPLTTPPASAAVQPLPTAAMPEFEPVGDAAPPGRRPDPAAWADEIVWGQRDVTLNDRTVDRLVAVHLAGGGTVIGLADRLIGRLFPGDLAVLRDPDAGPRHLAGVLADAGVGAAHTAELLARAGYHGATIAAALHDGPEPVHDADSTIEALRAVGVSHADAVALAGVKPGDCEARGVTRDQLAAARHGRAVLVAGLDGRDVTGWAEAAKLVAAHSEEPASAARAMLELTRSVEARAASLIGVAGDNPDGLWRLVAAVADQLDAVTMAAVTEMAGCAPTVAAAALSLVDVSPELIADTIVARCDGDAPAASRILADCGVATATAPAPTAPPATGIDDGLRRRGRRVIDDWSALTTTPGGESPDQPRLRLVTADHVHRPTP